MANALYYGDNLDVLRSEIKSDSVDLVYLDPPFNLTLPRGRAREGWGYSGFGGRCRLRNRDIAEYAQI